VKAAIASLLVLFGCGDNIGGEEPLAPGPSGWKIDVDMSGLDRFVPAGTTTWTVGGHARSSLPLVGVEVAGEGAPLSQGDFARDVETALGMTIVPIIARDSESHARQAHRTLLSAHFLPEGAINDRIATVTLSDQVLAGINAQIKEATDAIDIPGQIMAQDPLFDDGTCIIRPASASSGQLLVQLQRKRGTELWLNVKLPNLLVTFSGQCTNLGIPIRIAGSIGGTFDISTKLTANAPPAGEACLSSFDHTLPTCAITGWVYNIYSPDGPVQTALIRTLAPTSAEAEDMIHDGLVTSTDQLLTEQLASFELLDQTQTFPGVGGEPIEMHVCLAALGPENGKLVVRVAGDVAGAGVRDAPGAPMLATSAPVTADNEMLLDSGLISQLVFSSWRDNAFVQEIPQAVEISLLALLVRELGDAFPNATHADIAVDGELPPFIRATPDVAGADLRLEISDLMVTLEVEGQMIMKFNIRIALDIDFKAMDGMLVPTSVGSQVDAFLIDELYDGPDDALELAIESGLAQAVGDIFSGGGGVGIPEVIPGIGRVTDIVPDAGGRYLRLKLAPAVAPLGFRSVTLARPIQLFGR
jgi:hypothetical protein